MVTPDDPRLLDLCAQIEARLEKVCAEWPRPAFLDVVHRMAEITMKYDLQAPAVDGLTQTLIDDMRALADKAAETREKTV